MLKKYERPLHPLSSWTDTLCSDDDDDSGSITSDAFPSIDDFEVEFSQRHNDAADDDWTPNPKCEKPLPGRKNHCVEKGFSKHRRHADRDGTLSCFHRNACSRKWRIFCAVTILLLGLLWATVHVGVRNAKRRNNPNQTGDNMLTGSAPSAGTPTADDDKLPISPPDEDSNDSVNENDFSPSQTTAWPTIYQEQLSSPNPSIQPTLPPADSAPSDQAPNAPTSQIGASVTASPSTRPIQSPTISPSFPPTSLQLTQPPTVPPVPPQPVEEAMDEDKFVDEVEQIEDEGSLTASQEHVIVLYPDEYLAAGQSRSSPNGQYSVELTNGGDLVLSDHGGADRRTIWSSKTAGSGVRLFLQPDGNLLLRNGQGATLWTTQTHGYPGARLFLTDWGKLSIENEDNTPTFMSATSTTTASTAIWLDGIPRGTYRGPPPPNEEIEYPVRGAFYYPWYPQTWTVNGHQAHFASALGAYSSSDPEVARAHVDAMDYAHIDLSIASWWGPDTNLDKARLTMLMDQTIAMNSPLKWSVYHEDERDLNPSPAEIKADLDYLKTWFAWHQAWAHKDGKPVIFVYNEAGCDVARRWSEASNGEWYVVLKLFKGFEGCPSQPDSWHQYGCGMEDGTIHNPGHSFVSCPGFWLADQDIPLVPRVSQDSFCQSTEKMVASGAQWQLIVSFNEAGEGTMIENSPNWPSSSGFGQYLDCLNRHH